MTKKFRAIIAPLLLLSIVIVCSLLRDNVVPDDNSKIQSLSVAKIMEIENNFSKLKAGMPVEKALSTLGLADYQDVVFGSGPMRDYRCVYHLSSGYSLVIAFDTTKKPSGLNWTELRQNGKTVLSLEK